MMQDSPDAVVPVIVTVVPEIEHPTLPAPSAKVTVPPGAVAVRPTGVWSYALFASVPNVIACEALAIVKLCVTFGAALYVALPPCEATMMQDWPAVVAPVIVTMVPLTEHPTLPAPSAN